MLIFVSGNIDMNCSGKVTGFRNKEKPGWLKQRDVCLKGHLTNRYLGCLVEYSSWLMCTVLRVQLYLMCVCITMLTEPYAGIKCI